MSEAGVRLGVLARPYPAAERAQRVQQAWRARRLMARPSLEATFAFAIFVTSLFMVQLGTLGAAIFVLAPGAYALLRWRRLIVSASPALLVLLLPLLAVASILWSDARGETLKYSLELVITAAVGLMLVAAKDRPGVLKALFLAYAAYLVASLAWGQTVRVGAFGATAFSGLSASKNMFADITATGAIVSLGLMFWGLSQRRLGWALAAFVLLALEIYLLLAARSAGGLLAVLASLGALTLLTLLRGAGRVGRGLVLGFIGLCVLPLALSYRQVSTAMIDAAAQMFDKDPTLTGRTYLWYRANDLIEQRPLLGHGYAAFWRHGNLDAEGLWRYAGIGSRGGYNFHNTFVDLQVELGWLGLAAFVIVATVAIAKLAARFVTNPSQILCFWIAVLVYQLVRTPMETVGLAPFYFTGILLYAGLAAGFVTGDGDRRVRRRAAIASPSRQPASELLDPPHFDRVLKRGFSRSAASRPTR